jgi:cellulose biosynthesis protein BcsQ
LAEAIAFGHQDFRVLIPTVAETNRKDDLYTGEGAADSIQSVGCAVVTERPCLERLLEKCDVMLADSALWDEMFCGADADRTESLREHFRKVVVLTDGADDVACDVATVDKYGGCAAIVAAARLQYAIAVRGAVLRGTGIAHPATEIFSFFGLEGGAGTSSVAMGIARELSAYRDKRVTYVSMEPFESKRLCLKERPGAGDLSDYIYAFLKGDRNRLRLLRNALMIADEYGVRRFYPPEGFNPLRELDESEWFEWIGYLIDDGKTDCLVIDWGNAFEKNTRAGLASSQHRVMVTRGNGTKSRDDAEWLRYIACALKIDVENLVVAVNFADDLPEAFEEADERSFDHRESRAPGRGEAYVSDCRAARASDRRETQVSDRRETQVPDRRAVQTADCREAQVSAVIRIGRDAFDFNDTGCGIEIELNGEFGRGVKQLADHLLRCDTVVSVDDTSGGFGDVDVPGLFNEGDGVRI